MAKALAMVRPCAFSASQTLSQRAPSLFAPRLRPTAPFSSSFAPCRRWRAAVGGDGLGLHGRSHSELRLAGGGHRHRFCTRASHVNDAGSIDSPLMESMQKKIKEHLNAESVVVKDAYGDGRHVSIDVVASSFEGQSTVNRQRMVYKAIWEELQSTVHAVDQMTTRTPSEAASS